MQKLISLSDVERDSIVELLSATPISLDTLVKMTNLPIPVIQAVCLELELAGRIIRHSGNKIGLVYTY
jgi:DNA processing protein